MTKKIKSFNNVFYDTFLGILNKKGKKTKAKKILDQIFLKLSKKTCLPSNVLLYRLFYKLNTFVEIRQIKFRRSSHFVPFYIPFSRRIYLAVKWILLAINDDTRKVPLEEKLLVEIFKILKNIPSSSFKAKSLNNLQAFTNKSNIHYRW